MNDNPGCKLEQLGPDYELLCVTHQREPGGCIRALEAELARVSDGWTEVNKRLGNAETEVEGLKAERDALKAELERLKAEIREHRCVNDKGECA